MDHTSQSFVGISTNRTDWPYRYRITRSDNKWSGTVERRVSTGWIHLDDMHITKQVPDRISFTALLGEPGSAFAFGWSLNLEDFSRQSFRGSLIGDVFDSSFVELQFTRCNGEP